MKHINLETTVKWQKTDNRNVIDVRKKVVMDVDLPEGLIFEIGCADGNFFEFLQSHKNNYVGIDLDLNQINKAKIKYPTGHFIHGDVSDYSNLIEKCEMIVSFQVIEHIENDFDLFDKIESGKRIVFSVPNFPYREKFIDGHKRYYELNGWIDRYKNILDITEAWTIKHYKKNRKIFVFQCYRR